MPFGEMALADSKMILQRLQEGKRSALDSFQTIIDMEDKANPQEAEIIQCFHIAQTLCERSLEEIFRLFIREDELLHVHTLICCFDYCLSTSAAVKYVLRFKGDYSWIQLLEGRFTLFMQNHFDCPDEEGTFILGILSRILHIFTKCLPFVNHSEELQDIFSNLLIIRSLETDIERRLKADPAFRATEKGRRTFMIMTQMRALNKMMGLINSGTPMGYEKGMLHERVSVCNPGYRYYVFCSNPRCRYINVRDRYMAHCGDCLLTRYCTKKCQKLHWKNGHKENCLSLKNKKTLIHYLSPRLNPSRKGLDKS